MSQVSIERRGDVAIISVDNPPVNALSQPVREGLKRCIEEAVADDDLKAIVSTVLTAVSLPIPGTLETARSAKNA